MTAAAAAEVAAATTAAAPADRAAAVAAATVRAAAVAAPARIQPRMSCFRSDLGAPIKYGYSAVPAAFEYAPRGLATFKRKEAVTAARFC